MAHEADIQTRLKRLVAQTHGAEAELALQRLSMFLNERFGGAAIKVFAPHHPDHYIQTMDYLFERGFIHKLSKVIGEYGIWREQHWPWDNNNFYWIDPEVVQHYHPAPTENEEIFAAYAAFIFRHSGGVSKKTFEIYLRLMDWAQEHKPDIAAVFAQQVVKRYGGTDPRLHEKLYEIAGLRGLVGVQAQTMWRLSKMAMRENNRELAVKCCHRVLAVGNPETDSTVAYPHVRVLETLAHIAEEAQQWEQARSLYEKALALREAFFRQNCHTFEVWLRLCRVTERMGDTAAHHVYGEKVRANVPVGLRDYLKHTTPEASGRKRYIQQLELHTQSRMPTGYVLWHWGRFEYSYGHHAEGCRLCELAIIEFEAQFSYVPWGNVGDMNDYSLVRENQELFLKELRIGLDAMNCRTNRDGA